MKELSIEQKAKAYDEALSVARKTYQTQPMYRNWLEKMFPELAESEDERIRKAIIKALRSHSNSVNSLSSDGFKMEDAISWLEKQCEKPQRIVSAEAKEAMYDKLAPVRTGAIGFDGEPMESKPCEQKPAENKGMNLVEEEMTPFQKKVFCIIDTTIEQEQGLKQVCDELLRLAHDEIIQTPVAWSEEDESLRLRTIGALETCKIGSPTKCVDEQIDWLKSLKPNHWKPSDEQMDALDYYANSLCTYCDRQDDLRSLFNVLKKLRDEK